MGHSPITGVHQYPYNFVPPEDYEPKPEPQPELQRISVVGKEGGRRWDPLLISTVATLVGGSLALLIVMGARYDAIADRLPEVVQADGFIGAHPATQELSFRTPKIVLQATPTCMINGVDIVTVNRSDGQSWGGSIADITQYSITESLGDGTITVNTFHDYEDFALSGLKEKICS